MKKINLSIIIPVYNVENYLSDCIESIISQINDECEVILVNDGSTDLSGKICEGYANNQNIILINQENKGLSAARNSGIKIAKGKYIMFVDSDDFLTDQSINLILNKITQSEADFILIRSKSFIDGKKEFAENQIDYDKYKIGNSPIEAFKILDENDKFWFAAWLIIIKKEYLILNNLFFESGIYHEDELWVPIVFIKANSFEYINKCLYCYRLNRNGSIVNKLNVNKILDKIKIIDELLYICEDLDINKKEVLYGRCAALEWGLILQYEEYKNVNERKIIHDEISKRIFCLKYKKYYIIYLLSVIFDIKIISKLFNLK